MDDLFLRNRRRQYRRSPDEAHELRARLRLGERWVEVGVLDTSAGGLGVGLDPLLEPPALDTCVEVQLQARVLPAPLVVRTTVRFVQEAWTGGEGAEDATTRLGLQLVDVAAFYKKIVPGLLGQFNRRAVQRLDTSGEGLELEVRYGGVRGRVAVQDLSTWGMCVLIGPAMPPPHIGWTLEVVGTLPGDADYRLELVTSVRHLTRGDDSTRVGLVIDRDATPDYAGAEASLAMYAIRFQRDRARR